MSKEDWERHYDNLFWTITTIFAAAIGGLFTYVNSNPDLWLSIFGVILTGIAIYFAASFRQLRHNFNEDKEKKADHLPQWYAYILIFLMLGLLWIRLISNRLCITYLWCSFIPIGILVMLWSIYCTYMACEYNKLHRN